MLFLWFDVYILFYEKISLHVPDCPNHRACCEFCIKMKTKKLAHCQRHRHTGLIAETFYFINELVIFTNSTFSKILLHTTLTAYFINAEKKRDYNKYIKKKQQNHHQQQQQPPKKKTKTKQKQTKKQKKKKNKKKKNNKTKQNKKKTTKNKTTTNKLNNNKRVIK